MKIKPGSIYTLGKSEFIGQAPVQSNADGSKFVILLCTDPDHIGQNGSALKSDCTHPDCITELVHDE